MVCGMGCTWMVYGYGPGYQAGSECGAQKWIGPCVYHRVCPIHLLHDFQITQLYADVQNVSTIFFEVLKINFTVSYGSGRTMVITDMPRTKLQPAEDTSTHANRLVVPLTASDEIDWESVRPSQKEQLLSIVNNDLAILEHIGISHESGHITEDGEVLPEITLENVATGLDILSQANALLFRMLAPMVLPSHPLRSLAAGKKVPFELDKDIVLAAFKFTKAQHEEMDPRALRLAQKYMPEAAKKNLDIWLLGGMFLKFSADNAGNAIKMQFERDKKRMQQGPQVVPPQAVPDKDNLKGPAPVPPNGHATDTKMTNEDVEVGGESLEPGAEPTV
jgi:hypothetical protein